MGGTKNYKRLYLIHPTLRGIFLCLQRNRLRLCSRTVFSQTQKTKNVCLKRRFKFVVGKTTNLKPLPVCLERVSLFLTCVALLSTMIQKG